MNDFDKYFHGNEDRLILEYSKNFIDAIDAWHSHKPKTRRDGFHP